jgi:superoxide dismutase
MKHTLPDLPYDYNALEPVISADIMKVSNKHGLDILLLLIKKVMK